MARPIKHGLDYFPFDVDFFNDEKMVAIAGEYGIKGEITTIKLLCAVYRNGYFIEWSEMLKYKLLKDLPGVSPELFDQIVNRLVKWGFFDKDLFDSASVLTSKGIQRRFQAISTKMHRKNAISLYSLLESPQPQQAQETTAQTGKPKSKKRTPGTETPVEKHTLAKSGHTPVTVDESVAIMLVDTIWNEPVCMRYKLTPEQFKQKIANFRLHCLSQEKQEHESVADAKRHFCNLLAQGKLDDITTPTADTPADYTYSGGFGSKDSLTMAYPQTLIDELANFGKKPTGDLEWDRAVLRVLRHNDPGKSAPWLALDKVVSTAKAEIKKAEVATANLADPNVYQAHADLVVFVANEIVLKPQRRRFEVDAHNKDVLRFLLYYFNGCPLAEDVFPDRGYKLHKNIMLQGKKGSGKTMMMQIFSEYLRRTKNPRFFENVSVTQMVNHFSLHNNIDLYTYNEAGSTGFRIKPLNLCLNDIGVENRPFYGIDTLTVVTDFLHARNELWANQAISDRKFAHLTTNLDTAKLKAMFKAKDEYDRIVDRFKTYNVIPLTGESRR